MIRSIGWFCAEHYGVWTTGGESYWRASPALSDAGGVLSLVGRPVKYYSRMTEETRCCLCAAKFAMDGARWKGDAEIGMIGTASGGLIAANREYFRDYVENGRSMGRGNLFIYTLATSPLGETAIALSLTGPSLFMRQERDAMRFGIARAKQIAGDKEAAGMLVVASEARAAVCVAVDEESAPSGVLGELRLEDWSGSAREICQRVRGWVESK